MVTITLREAIADYLEMQISCTIEQLTITMRDNGAASGYEMIQIFTHFQEAHKYVSDTTNMSISYPRLMKLLTDKMVDEMFDYINDTYNLAAQ